MWADGGRRLFRSNPTWCRIVLRGSIKRRVDCPLITLDWAQGTVLDPGQCFPHRGLSFPNHLPEFAHTVKDGRSWGRAGLISNRGHVEVFQSSPLCRRHVEVHLNWCHVHLSTQCGCQRPHLNMRCQRFLSITQTSKDCFPSSSSGWTFPSYMGDWESPVMKKGIYCLIVSTFYLNLPICPEENQYDGDPVVTYQLTFLQRQMYKWCDLSHFCQVNVTKPPNRNWQMIDFDQFPERWLLQVTLKPPWKELIYRGGSFTQKQICSIDATEKDWHNGYKYHMRECTFWQTFSSSSSYNDFGCSSAEDVSRYLRGSFPLRRPVSGVNNSSALSCVFCCGHSRVLNTHTNIL